MLKKSKVMDIVKMGAPMIGLNDQVAHVFKRVRSWGYADIFIETYKQVA
jgi:hypothetical protein